MEREQENYRQILLREFKSAYGFDFRPDGADSNQTNQQPFLQNPNEAKGKVQLKYFLKDLSFDAKDLTTVGCLIDDQDLIKSIFDVIKEDVYDVLTLEGSVAARDHIGGTAPNQVRAAIERARTRMTNG